MPFCPKCRYEYREGIKMCSDCKIPLVDQLEEDPKKKDKNKELTFEDLTEKQQAEVLQAYAKASAVHGDVSNGFSLDPTEETETTLEEIEANVKAQAVREKPQPYFDKRAKAAEYKSSGIVLIGVGIVGIVGLVLTYMGVILNFTGLKSNYLFMGVMGFMFIAFVISGFMSFDKIKTYLAMAEKEEALIKDANDYMIEHFTRDNIAKVTKVQGEPSEDDYFTIFSFMMQVLHHQFPEMEMVLAEKLVDERICIIYENLDH